MDAQPAPEPFSASDFRLRAAREITDAAGGYGDHRLNPDLADMIPTDKLRDAAVLIAVVDRGAGSTLLLTKRNERLRAHSGQIAFPGGRLDATDASPEAAALRETHEEIGLAPRFVEVVGRIPDYLTGSGYRVAPVLAVVRPPLALVLNPDEVDAAFEVPLRFLMDPANHRKESRHWNERERFFYVMPWEDRRIWGITAGIIRTLYERLYA
jgi:8-oxo-dGTP pyrophosphatase MutT (NUDIX family)